MKSESNLNKWDPNDAGLNTDPDPGNYSTGREDMENADPEKTDPDEAREKKPEQKEKGSEQQGTPNKGGG